MYNSYPFSRPHWRSNCASQRVSQPTAMIIILFIDQPQSWSPLPVLRHCLIQTQCKLIIVDAERADRLEPIVSDFAKEAGPTGILILEAHDSGRGRWKGTRHWNQVLDEYTGSLDAITVDPAVAPEDNASILFTSGKPVH
jgi:long-subunit acyl-CoA synthetase (AMP-forming)